MPTADMEPLLRAARAALGLIFRAGYRYQRAEWVLLDLSPAAAEGAMGSAPSAEVEESGRARRRKLIWWGGRGRQAR